MHRRRKRAHAQRSRRRVVLITGAAVVGVVIVFLVIASFSSYRSLSQARKLLNQAHVTITTSIGNEGNLESPSGRTTALRGIAQVSADATEAEQDLHSPSVCPFSACCPSSTPSGRAFSNWSTT